MYQDLSIFCTKCVWKNLQMTRLCRVVGKIFQILSTGGNLTPPCHLLVLVFFFLSVIAGWIPTNVDMQLLFKILWIGTFFDVTRFCTVSRSMGEGLTSKIGADQILCISTWPLPTPRGGKFGLLSVTLMYFLNIFFSAPGHDSDKPSV